MEELEQRLNTELVKKKKILKLGIIIILVSFLCFLFASFTYLKLKKLKLVLAPFLCFMISCVFVVIYKNSFMKYIKKVILKTIIPQLFNNKKVEYIPGGMSRVEFDMSGIYSDYNNYYTSDGIKSFDESFYISNVTVIKKEENSKKYVFLGVFGYTKTEEFFADEIIIKPDVENKYVSNIINTKNKMFGNNENVVRLENNEFEKYFEVYSKNQLKARQVITVDYMERILKMKSDLNTIFKIVYKGNKKYVAIWNKRIIDEKEIYRKGINLQEIKLRIEKIYKVFENV